MKKLSYRAKLLLLLVDQKTERDDKGQLTRFFVPSAYDEYLHTRDGRTLKNTVWVQGSGDANCFKGLERAGLIERPDTSLRGGYIYAITEEGRIAVESFWDELS